MNRSSNSQYKLNLLKKESKIVVYTPPPFDFWYVNRKGQIDIYKKKKMIRAEFFVGLRNSR